jgi:catechol-2,3-dioxygenase
MSKPPILGIAEIVLSVRDLPAMRAFYQQVLGFRLHSEASHRQGAEPDDGDPTICFLTIAPTDTPLGANGHPLLLALIDHQQHVFAKSRFSGHDVTTSTLNHLAFEVALQDFEAHYERLVSLGLQPTLSEFPHMQAKAIFFRDPEGNPLELICHSPKY